MAKPVIRNGLKTLADTAIPPTTPAGKPTSLRLQPARTTPACGVWLSINAQEPLAAYRSEPTSNST